MPKMKTHRGAAKRFKITGSGKFLRRKAYKSHLLEHKSPARKRRLSEEVLVEGGDRRKLRKLLGV